MMSAGEAIAYALATVIAVIVSVIGFTLTTLFYILRFLLSDPNAPFVWGALFFLLILRWLCGPFSLQGVVKPFLPLLPERWVRSSPPKSAQLAKVIHVKFPKRAS